MSTYNFEVPKTWTVADGQVYAILSPELTLWVVWKLEGQTGTAGFQAELYNGEQLLSTAFWTWTAQDIAEFIQLVKPADAVNALAKAVEAEGDGEGEGTLSLRLEPSLVVAPADAFTAPEGIEDGEVQDGGSSPRPGRSSWERLKPALAKTWGLTKPVGLWTADMLISLMLLFQARQRRIAPTKRRAWPKGLKEHLMRQQRNRCVYCGHRYSAHYLDIDHMDPVAYGGSNDPSNLQVLCGPCNRRKGDQTDREFRRRYSGLVPSRRLTPPSRPVSQSHFDAVSRRTGASIALRQRRRLRFITAREKITTGSAVSGVVAFAAVYLGLDGLGIQGDFVWIPAAILGLAVGAGLWLRARATGALYT